MAKPRPTFRLLTWNIFGLEEAQLDERAAGVCDQILELRPLPDCINFQEVVRSNLKVLTARLEAAGYVMQPPTAGSYPYYCCMAYRSATTRVGQPLRPLPAQDPSIAPMTPPKQADPGPWNTTAAVHTLPFSNSKMDRHLIQARLMVHGRYPITVLTSHLESLDEFHVTRGAQMQMVLRSLRAAVAPPAEGRVTPAELAAFGGDANVRDEECRPGYFAGRSGAAAAPAPASASAAASGGAGSGAQPSPAVLAVPAVRDAWEDAGADAATRLTWDSLNPTNRYDRVWYSSSQWRVTSFRLIGYKRITLPPDCEAAVFGEEPMLPSDHAGLLIDFERNEE